MWLKEQGYACIVDPNNPIQEFSTFTCKHCGGLTHVRAKQDPAKIGGMCYQCSGLICPKCVGKECTPLMRRIEAAERRDYLRTQWEKL